MEFGNIASEGLTDDVLEQLVVDDFWYWFTLGTEWIVTGCEANRETSGQGDTVTCDVEANTFFDRTLDEADSPTPLRVTVEEGLITFGSTDYVGAGGGYQKGAIAFEAWVRGGIEDGLFEEAEVPCQLGRFYPPYRTGCYPMRGD